RGADVHPRQPSPLQRRGLPAERRAGRPLRRAGGGDDDALLRAAGRRGGARPRRHRRLRREGAGRARGRRALMAIRLFRRRPRAAVAGAGGPVGVEIHVRPYNIPGAEKSGRVLPTPIWWGLLIAVVFYVLAHASVIIGVWPVHGTSA